MKVELSDRALREMQRIDVSWRARASSPDVFLDELEKLVEWIESTGVIGPVYDAKANAKCIVYCYKRAGTTCTSPASLKT